MDGIRRATADDEPELLLLCEEYCHADGHRFDRATVLGGLRPLLADDERGVVVVAEAGGTLDGYVVATWGWSIEIGGLEVVLDELYVRDQGRGTGGRLIEAIEAECRARNALRIFLETERPNERARRLYARHGYVADDSIWMSKELH